MGQADVAYMIQRIYEKYNTTQNDKKYEERVYMEEDEFRYNLEEMVRKSPILDKALLYKEIYRNISENSLEIDSNGTITISPKLIIAVEKEIQMQQKRTNKIISSEESEVDQNDAIWDKLSLEAYEELSEEEKDDLFYESAGWMFGSEEEAAKARKELEDIEVDTTVDAIEASDNMHKGKTVTEESYKKTTGDDIVPANKAFMQSRVDLKAVFQGMLADDRLKLLFTEENGKAKVNMPFLNIIAQMVRKKENLTFDEIELVLKNMFEEKIDNDPNFKLPTPEQIEGLRKFVQDKDAFVGTIKMLQLMGKMDKDGQMILRMDDSEMQQELYAQICQSDELTLAFYSLITTLKLKVSPYTFSITDNQYGNENPGSVQNSVQLTQAMAERAMTTYNNFIDTKVMDRTDVHMDKKELDAQMDRLKREPITEGLVFNDVSSDAVHQGVKTRTGIPEGETTKEQEEVYRVFTDRTLNPKDTKMRVTDRFGALKMDTRTKDKIMSVEEDARILVDRTVNPQMFDSKGAVNVETLDVLIDASLEEIDDDRVDMFAGMFEAMAEEMVVGTTEVEHDHDVEGEIEAVEDAPAAATVAVPSGLVAEEVLVGETEEKVNETVVPPVVNEPEVVEEPKAPESPEQPGMLAVDTLSNKIKRGLNELGKKVKGVFGKIAGLFGGGSSDTGNNTGTTGTGGIVQDTKDSKASQAPGQDFIQHVDLKFDFLKNESTEKGSEPAKPKGVDDPTQGFEVDD